MNEEPASKKGKGYVKVSNNIPDPLYARLKRVVDIIGTDQTKLIVRALEEKMPDYEREADALLKVRGESPRKSK